MSSTNRGATRNALDYYETPLWAAAIGRDILYRETHMRIGIVDAGCGTGAIGKCFRGATGVELDGHRCQTAIGKGYYEKVHHADFLRWVPKQPVLAVISNPPYRQAQAFIDRALALTAGPVVMLLRLAFLAGQKRRDWWQEHPADVHVLSRRPSFTGRGTDSSDYAWFVFGGGKTRGKVVVL
jgi:hypothetical protein